MINYSTPPPLFNGNEWIFTIIFIFFGNKHSYLGRKKLTQFWNSQTLHDFKQYHAYWLRFLFDSSEAYWLFCFSVLLKSSGRIPEYYFRKDVKKSRKKQCLTWTCEKTSHITWTLYIKLWVICLHNLYTYIKGHVELLFFIISSG